MYPSSTPLRQAQERQTSSRSGRARCRCRPENRRAFKTPRKPCAANSDHHDARETTGHSKVRGVTPTLPCSQRQLMGEPARRTRNFEHMPINRGTTTMNEIAKRESTTGPADGWDDTAAEAEARLIRGSLLKFRDWKWSIGKEKEAVEVKEGRRLIAVATAAAWVKWREDKPVEYRLREPGGSCRTAWILATMIERNGSSAPTARAARSVAEHALRAPDRSADRRGFHILDLELWRPRLRDQSCRPDQAYAGQAPRCGADGRTWRSTDVDQVRETIQADVESGWLAEHGSRVRRCCRSVGCHRPRLRSSTTT